MTLPYCDFHVHIGKFHDLYFKPAQTARELKSIGIRKWYVSSTSTCDIGIDFQRIVDEFAEMRAEAPEETLANLWLTKEMIDKSPYLEAYDAIEFKMLKIHPYIHSWSPHGKEIEHVFSVAAARGIPLMIHTGGKPEAEAGQFQDICRRHPEVTVLLAHCRPLDQTLNLLQNAPNVYGDISFASPESVMTLLAGGVCDRLCFGSDYPLDMLFFPGEDPVERYENRLRILEQRIGGAVLDNLGKCKQLLP